MKILISNTVTGNAPKGTKTLCQLIFSLILFIAISVLLPADLKAETAQEYITSGETQLFLGTIAGAETAHDIFSNAKRDHTNDPVINTYLALTRVIHLGLSENTGGLTNLLHLFGIERKGTSIDTIDFTFPEHYYGKRSYPPTDGTSLVFPENSPTGEALRSFMGVDFVNALDLSINNLNTAISNWPSPSGVYILDKNRFNPALALNIEIDIGDIYFLRGSLSTLKSLLLMSFAHNMDINIHELNSLIEMDALSIKSFLERYTNALKLVAGSPSGATMLDNSRTALISAIDDLLTASTQIQNDNQTTAGAEELLTIDSCDLQQEKWARTNLLALKTSLSASNPETFNLIDTEETWIFTDSASGNTLEASLYNMFEGDWHGIDENFFLDRSGEITCITINGSTISLNFEFWTDNYGEVLFTGTYDANAGTISGTYSGSSTGIPVTGSFTATRIPNPQNEGSMSMDLNPFFGNGSGPYNFRDMLPRFNTYDEPIAGTMGHGMGDDPTLGGIFPDFTQGFWDFEGEVCGVQNIPEATITFTGNISDWNGISPMISNSEDDPPPGLTGTNIKDVYIAKDATFLYMAMSLWDGGPNIYSTYSISFSDEFGFNGWYDAYSACTAIYNGESWTTDIKLPPETGQITDGSTVMTGESDLIEWKTPLNNIGDLSGKFLNASTNNNTLETCTKIAPVTSITGTLNIPSFSSNGRNAPIYLYVFGFDNNGFLDREKRLALGVIYSDEFTEGMTYTINDLPVGKDILIRGYWDADGSGTLTFGDSHMSSSVKTTTLSEPLSLDITMETFESSLTGTITSNQYTTGNIYIMVYNYRNTDILQTDTLTGPGLYSLENLPPNTPLSVNIFWDRDGDGNLGPGDYFGFSRWAPIYLKQGETTLDLEANLLITGTYSGEVSVPYFDQNEPGLIYMNLYSENNISPAGIVGIARAKEPGTYSGITWATINTTVISAPFWDHDSNFAASTGDYGGWLLPVKMMEGNTIIDRDIDHRVTGIIKGTVRNPDNSPITGESLFVYATVDDSPNVPNSICDGFKVISSAWTSPVDGTYALPIFESATYYITTENGNTSYTNQWFNWAGSNWNCINASPLYIYGPDSEYTGIDFQLSSGFAITGKIEDVTSDETRIPLPGLMVMSLSPGNYQWRDTGITDQNGTFIVYGAQTKSYLIYAMPSFNQMPYKDQWYSEAVPTGTTDINFTLEMIGDINDDGRVDLRDLITGLKLFSLTGSVSINKNSDVNGNGKIDQVDLLTIIQGIAELRQPLPLQ